mmetsp:Transcript_33324/g.61385  ORF Transcript_33324/g.61385 Transcript_33324/m.61385 type:complete len:83 (+) Transcript_33324:104-352(+)
MTMRCGSRETSFVIMAKRTGAAAVHSSIPFHNAIVKQLPLHSVISTTTAREGKPHPIRTPNLKWAMLCTIMSMATHRTVTSK